jgi:predicted nucleotidyltransferase
MSRAIPEAAQSAVDRYTGLLNATLPGVVSGIYLTGSIALGDWRPERSDLDILVVTSRALGPADLAALAGLHARLAERPFPDAIYAGHDDVGRAAAAGSPGLPHAVDGNFQSDGYLADPVLWATLDRRGVTVLGPSAASLGAGPDPAWLRAWNLGNLASYWRPWAAGLRGWAGRQEPGQPLGAAAAMHGLLGPGRLHYTITTGGLLAKTDSAEYTDKLVPGYGELLGRAREGRLGGDTVEFTARDAFAMSDLIEAVADAADRFAAGA